MKSREPIISCDGDDGECGIWAMDYYARDVSTVNGVRMTRVERAPGWVSIDDDDFCPEHGPRADTKDRRPHSRACGVRPHDHGLWCNTTCPTCGGKP